MANVGLSIVEKMVKFHIGKIKVKSKGESDDIYNNASK